MPQYASTEEALKARAQGPGAPLKKFHNDIKRQLINRCGGDRWRVGRPRSLFGRPALQASSWLQGTLVTLAAPMAGVELLGLHTGCMRSWPPLRGPATSPSVDTPPRMSRFASGAGSLLDFACGRGGDIWKWIDAGIPVVKGVDLSPGEIEEARKR